MEVQRVLSGAGERLVWKRITDVGARGGAQRAGRPNVEISE